MPFDDGRGRQSVGDDVAGQPDQFPKGGFVHLERVVTPGEADDPVPGGPKDLGGTTGVDVTDASPGPDFHVPPDVTADATPALGVFE